MNILDTFFILFKSDTKEVDKGMDESKEKAGKLIDEFKKVDLSAQGVNATLKDMAMRGAAILGLSLSITALYSGIKKNAEEMAALDKLAAKLGTTADAVDQFMDQGALLSLDEDVTKGGLEALNQAAQDTALGMGRAKKVFEELGITVTDASGKVKPITSLMSELATTFKDMDKGKQIRVMERLGLNPALLKLFNADLADLNERLETIDKSAGFNFERTRKLSGEFVKSSNALKIELNSIGTFFEKLKSAAYTEFLPIIIKGIKAVTFVMHELFDFITKHSDFVRGAILGISIAITAFLVPAAIKGAIAVAAMLAPFILVGAAVAAVIAIFALFYEDIAIYMAGGKSLVGRFLPPWDELKEKIGEVSELLGFFAKLFRAVADVGAMAWKIMFGTMGFVANEGTNTILAQFERIKNYVLEIAEQIKKVFIEIYESINKALSALGMEGGIGDFLDQIKKSASGAFEGFKKGVMAVENTGVVDQLLNFGRDAIGLPNQTPLSSTTSSAITNSTNTTNKNTEVRIDKVEVNAPQATNADGISKEIGNSLTTQMRQAISNYDDGVRA